MHPASKISDGSQGDHDKSRDKKPVLIERDPANEEDVQHPCNKYTNGREWKTDPDVRRIDIPHQEYGCDQQHCDDRRCGERRTE